MKANIVAVTLNVRSRKHEEVAPSFPTTPNCTDSQKWQLYEWLAKVCDTITVTDPAGQDNFLEVVRRGLMQIVRHVEKVYELERIDDPPETVNARPLTSWERKQERIQSALPAARYNERGELVGYSTGSPYRERINRN